MPKYKKRYQAKKQVEPPKQSKKTIKQTASALNISRISALFVLVFSIAISLYFIHNKTKQFDDFIPVSDEINIISCVENHAPTHSFFKTIFRMYDNIDINARYYAYETYLRYYVYAAMKDSSTDWGTWSSLAYLYMIFLSVLLFTIFSKNMRNIIIPVAFAILLLGVSDWTNASFHYLRYYPFLIMASMLAMFANTYILIYGRFNIYLKSVAILIVSIIPVLFHNQGAFMLLFWIAVVFVFLIINVLKNGSKTHYLVLASIFVVGVYIFYRWVWGSIMFGLTKLDLQAFYPILVKFGELSFPRNWLGIIITILLVVSPIVSWKHLTKFDKTLMISSALLFIISALASASIMGDGYSGHNGANRYFTFTHSIQLIMFASFLSGIYKFAIDKINFKLKKEVVFVVLSIPLISGIYSFTELTPTTYNFSILPQIRKSELKQQKSHINCIDYAVVSSHTQSASSAFPNRRVYHAKLLQQKQFVDTLKSDYILFYNVAENMLQDSFKQVLRNKGYVMSEMFVVKCDSIR